MQNRIKSLLSEEPSLPILIELLKQVELSDEIAQGELSDDGRRYLTNGVPDELPSMIQRILEIADSVLITPKGECNWRAHDYLRGFGFNVTKGESDSFGWLTGCIHTKKGIVVYG